MAHPTAQRPRHAEEGGLTWRESLAYDHQAPATSKSPAPARRIRNPMMTSLTNTGSKKMGGFTDMRPPCHRFTPIHEHKLTAPLPMVRHPAGSGACYRVAARSGKCPADSADLVYSALRRPSSAASA